MKIHCSVLAEDAIKAAVADYHKKQRRASPRRARPTSASGATARTLSRRRGPQASGSSRTRHDGDTRASANRAAAGSGASRRRSGRRRAGCALGVKGGGCSGFSYVIDWAADAREVRPRSSSGTACASSSTRRAPCSSSGHHRGLGADAHADRVRVQEPEREERLRLRGIVHRLMAPVGATSPGRVTCWSCSAGRRGGGDRLLPLVPQDPARSAGARTTSPCSGSPASSRSSSRDLERRFRELSRALHPDRFARAAARERRLSLERARGQRRVARAARPVTRAEALLRLAGMDGRRGRAGPRPTATSLMEVIERREDARGGATREGRAAVAAARAACEWTRASGALGAGVRRRAPVRGRALPLRLGGSGIARRFSRGPRRGDIVADAERTSSRRASRDFRPQSAAATRSGSTSAPRTRSSPTATNEPPRVHRGLRRGGRFCRRSSHYDARRRGARRPRRAAARRRAPARDHRQREALHGPRRRRSGDAAARALRVRRRAERRANVVRFNVARRAPSRRSRSRREILRVLSAAPRTSSAAWAAR